MKIVFLAVGKTTGNWLPAALEIYCERLKHYGPFEMVEIPDIKSKSKGDAASLRSKEADAILERLKPGDPLVLLDEKGKQMGSEAFARQLEKWMVAGGRQLVFAAGGAYGFHEKLKARALAEMSLSPMTFSHQMVRLIFTEQLYRAFTILNNEPYHHR